MFTPAKWHVLISRYALISEMCLITRKYGNVLKIALTTIVRLSREVSGNSLTSGKMMLYLRLFELKGLWAAVMTLATGTNARFLDSKIRPQWTLIYSKNHVVPCSQLSSLIHSSHHHRGRFCIWQKRPQTNRFPGLLISLLKPDVVNVHVPQCYIFCTFTCSMPFALSYELIMACHY